MEQIIVQSRGIKPYSAKQTLSYWLYGRKTVSKGKEYYLKPQLTAGLHYVRQGAKLIFTAEGKRRIEDLV